MSRGDLYRGIRTVAQTFGLDVRRFEPLRDSPAFRIATLCRAEAVDLLVDVGASSGTWAAAIRDAGFEGPIVSFEPHPSVFAELARRARGDPSWDVCQRALGDKEGRAELLTMSDTTWSSLLRAAHDSFEPTRPTGRALVDVRRLDAELAGSPAQRMFVKLDAQGYELAVLRGAEAILPRVQAGMAEVMLRALYEGQPLLDDFVEVLLSYGFSIVGVENGYIEPSGKERFLDVLFSRTPVS